MSLALWSILVAGLLPYLTVTIAKSGPGYDNNDPRGQAAGLEGRRKRAYAAHLNHFEAFPLFAAAVLVAELKGGGGTAVNVLALAFVAARIVYSWLYLTDRASQRSLVWFIGFGCVVTIFTSPLWR